MLSTSRTTSSTQSAPLGRRAAGAILLAIGGAMIAGPAFASSEVIGDGPSNVTIEQTPYATQGECQPALTALSNTVDSTSSIFKLTITASAPLCDPISASAVIYSMPGNTVAWPQTLVEKQTFTIKDAGVTTITFTKTCKPVQFDVVTGATPSVISPDGAWHGPLLFPFDTNTAQQWWGYECPAATTTTTGAVLPSSTVAPTTSIVGTTTTTPTKVLPATTIRPSTTVKTSTTVAASSTTVKVLGTSASRLATTGTSPAGIALVGGGFVIAGMGLIGSSHRRRI